MSIIKCKMCGGDLNLVEGSTVCECEYCGTKQTVPSADNEKKLTLFGRAGRLLRGCEFDKAAGVFETIVADFPQEAEAYWGLVLCKYGIEYVDDPATGKKIPTCHRSSFDSVMDDANFEQACENTDAVARRVYRDEARQIEELRQAILQVSGKEEPYDVFISYKETDEHGERTLDSVIAQDIYKELTNEGYRVFFSRISLEDKLGTEYEPYIFAALNSAKVMLVVGTDYENFDAVWVKNEWSRFLKLIAKGEKKTLIPVFKNMDAYDMPKEFAKLSAQDMGKVGAMQDLVRGVEKIVGKKKAEATAPVQQPMYVSNEADAKTAAAIKRGYMALEDSDWDKAKDYFDQALALDAECAEAYLGLALADEKCCNEDMYISRSCDIRPEQEKKSLLPDQERVEAAIQSYVVPGFLSEEQIRDLFRFDLRYDTDVKGAEKIAEQEKTAFHSNRNLTRALRFAKDETKARMDRFQSTLFSRLDDKVEETKQQEAAAKDKEIKAYEAHLATTEQRLVELHRQAVINRENAYQSACKKQATAKTIAEYQDAIGAFLQVEGYRDSDECIAQCRAAIEEIKEQNRIHKEADDKAAAEEAERQRILKEKADKQRRAKNKKIGIVIGILTVVAAAAFLFVIKVVIPERNYKGASALLDGGQYDEAIAAFEALGGYKDSVDQLAKAKDAKETAALLAEETQKEIKNAEAYEEAEKLLASGDYDKAIAAFKKLGDYRDSSERVDKCYEEKLMFLYEQAEKLASDGRQYEAAIAFSQIIDYKDSRNRSLELWSKITYQNTIFSGAGYTVGIDSDGAVVAAGYNDDGRCDVNGWTNIIAVSANRHTVGLRTDGTVVAVGSNEHAECDVSDWIDIVAISAGPFHTIGLRSDGTVVATEIPYRWRGIDYGQCDVSDWTDVVGISAGEAHTVGMHSDGTVVAVGSNRSGQCFVFGWTDIVAISAGRYFTVGLRSNGTVVAVGDNENGQCNVSEWADIVAISAGDGHTVGLRSDGTVVAVGDNRYGQCDVSRWTDIVAVSAGSLHTVGLRSDGTVVAVGANGSGECNIGGWTNIKLPNMSII